MILPRDRAADRPGGVTAKAIRYEPFAIEQDLARRMRAIPFHRADDCRPIMVLHLAFEPSVLSVFCAAESWRLPGAQLPLRQRGSSPRHSPPAACRCRRTPAI